MDTKQENSALKKRVEELESESPNCSRQDALDGQAALDEANNRVVELEQENDTLIDHNIRLIGDNTALKKRVEELDWVFDAGEAFLAKLSKAEKKLKELEKANDVLQNLYTAALWAIYNEQGDEKQE